MILAFLKLCCLILMQDEPDNITRFLVLARDPIIPRTDKLFKVRCYFKNGILLRLLKVS